MRNILSKRAVLSSEMDQREKQYILPKKIVWKTNQITNEDVLLQDKLSQPILEEDSCMIMKNSREGTAGILIDFGIEIQGGVQLTAIGSGGAKTVPVRIRFGESVMEAMEEMDKKSTATNDHAIRDMVVPISALNKLEIGQTGFRFVRIDLIGEHSELHISSIKAALLYHDIPYLGEFLSNDEQLNQIWETGAYTVHLNMQEYVWDGIKRDRLVWIGDLHPEIATIKSVFGYHRSVPKSLDLIRDSTPLPRFMNNFPSYSMWWVIIQHDWFYYTGDMNYLEQQEKYLVGLLDILESYVNADGTNNLPNPFIDWPTSENEEAVRAGVHSILTLAFQKGQKLIELLVGPSFSKKYDKVIERLTAHNPNPNGSKQAAALAVLAGIANPKRINDDLLSKDMDGLSTFLGYYVLLANAKANDTETALKIIREYWGAMLDLGATTFWEHFDIRWLENGARIDEFPSDGKIDVHGNYGDYCYNGFRHSLCHGWASGPTAWLSEVVLGIKIVKPGCELVEINPSLGDLQWVRGSFPTPYGLINVKHTKQQDGSIVSEVNAPPQVEIKIVENS